MGVLAVVLTFFLALIASRATGETDITPTGAMGKITQLVFGVLAVYALLIIFMNRKQVEVSFVFFSADISLLVLILLCVGIGFAAGYLFEQLRDRRRRRVESSA